MIAKYMLHTCPHLNTACNLYVWLKFETISDVRMPGLQPRDKVCSLQRRFKAGH